MRDLARQNLGRKSVPHIKASVSPRSFKLIAIVVGIVGAVLFLNSGLSLPVVGEAKVHDAPKGLVPVAVSGGPVSVKGGANLASDKATFRSVGSVKASGVAERVYGGGSFTMTVEAVFSGTNGHKFQVWLTDGETFADAGYLESSGTNWSTTFRDSDKGYSKLNQVWVTDELTTEDNKPETRILVGSF